MEMMMASELDLDKWIEAYRPGPTVSPIFLFLSELKEARARLAALDAAEEDEGCPEPLDYWPDEAEDGYRKEIEVDFKEGDTRDNFVIPETRVIADAVMEGKVGDDEVFDHINYLRSL